MSLMKLAPEAVRLRRIAKACAAGEFGLLDYRQARRDIIGNFVADTTGDDDTQPRFNLPDRHGVEPVQPPTKVRSILVRWVLLAVVVGSVFLAGQTFAQSIIAQSMFAQSTFAQSMNIPPVSERDPNPATSSRLPISRVTLGELEPLPGISREAVMALAGASLRGIQQRNQPASDGFTASELAELGRFLNALGAHDPEVSLSARDAADLSSLLRDQKLRRGISIVEIEEISAAIQLYYRDAGYFLAIAFVPSQEVMDGTVRLEVLPGVVGAVNVNGANGKIADRFNDLLGVPLTWKQINTRLYTLNQSPGIFAQANFEPGEQVGETVLNLNVVEQRKLSASVGLDNYGDTHTGEQRLVALGSWANPLQRGDALNVGLLFSVDPSNQTYGFAEYQTPVGGKYQFSGRLANNNFSTTDSIGVDGNGVLFDAVLEKFVYRERTAGLSFELGLGLHSLDWDSESIDVDQQVSMLSAALNGHRVWDGLQIFAESRIFADIGHIGGDTFAGQDDNFWDLGVELFAWRPFDLPLLPGRQKGSIKLIGQFSNMQLPSTRRLGLGGVSRARGFRRDVYIGDQGVLLRADLRTELPLGELVLFVDSAYGVGRNDLNPTWAYLTDLGVAWDARLASRIVSRLSLAIPVTAKGTGGLDDDGLQIFWSLQYAR